ncbi:MAG: hypothetical protein M1813_007777 [Trichoglossum hirsutum]|nr:MAG: hypothetical protein M1813_007777 [Trichoglossum hirsutum]
MNKTKRDARLENLRAVIEKLRIVRDDLQTPYLDDNSLSILGIQLSHLNLYDENGIDIEPHLCKPFPAQKFDELFERMEKDEWASEWAGDSPYWQAHSIETKFSKYLGCSGYRGDLVSNSIWKTQIEGMMGPKPQHKLRREMHVDPQREWQVPMLLNPSPRAEPHIACALVSYGDDEGRLLRSELLCALFLMCERMHLRKYQSHLIIPVFVYSFTGFRARVIQVHFDGGFLHVRLSEFLQFHWQNENVDNTKLLLRWMMNTPCRETAFHSTENAGGRRVQGDSPTPSGDSLVPSVT